MPTLHWLPTVSGKFYPDFVARLQDGTILVVEYKGYDRLNNDDTREKRAIGELWAAQMNGKGAFAMPSIPPGTPAGEQWDCVERGIREAIAR